jgi:ribosomal protein L37AE/L43A
MAIRADQLIDEDAMLARYVEAAERRQHRRLDAATNPDGTTDLLLVRYLRNLRTQPRPEGANLEHRDVRTCPSCGRREEFLEERGGWAECPACGHLA